MGPKYIIVKRAYTRRELLRKLSGFGVPAKDLNSVYITFIRSVFEQSSNVWHRDITSETKAFTNCFIGVQPVLKQADRWMNTLKTHCKKAFKLIRIRNQNIKHSGADKLITQRNKLIRQDVKDTQGLDAQIAEIISKEGMQKALMFEKYTDTNIYGAVSKIWKLKKSLFPKKPSTLPAAKLNYQNKIVSNPKELTELLGEEYGRIRLRKRPTHPLLIKGRAIRKQILKTKLRLSSQKKTEQFKMEDLETVLKTIQTNKAQDPEGISRIIFKIRLLTLI